MSGDGSDDTLPASSEKPGPVTGDGATVAGPSGADRTAAAGGDTLAGVAPARVVVRGGGGPDYRELRPVDPQHYAVAKEIARGGMGRILEARDRRLGRVVAIKELLTLAPDLRTRFEREARITARLQHPAIVSIHEAGEWPSGEPFYVMERVAGESLDKVIASRPTLESRLALLPNVIAAVDALAYAHSQQVIHRDLKPANVLVGSFGETVVIDWGLAKDLAATDDLELEVGPYRGGATDGETVAGSVMGTPAYMPVEQANGEPVDARADVYALGAMLYHLLSGAAPFTGKTTDEILQRVIDDRPDAIPSRVTGVPPDLVTIVEKAMARDAADRYPTAKELAEDLRKFQTGQLVGAHRYSTWQLIGRWMRRHRIALTVAGAAAALLVALGVVSLRRIFAEQRATERQSELTRQTRDEAEALLSFMLTDLRDKLLDVGKVNLLADVANRAVAYYANRGDELSDAERAKRAAARRNLGDVLRSQGDVDRALVEFRASLATAEDLVARQPGDLSFQHELALSHYKLGGALGATGDSAGALASHTRQREIAQRLVDAQPANAVWLRTFVAAHTSLGRVLTVRGDTAGSLASFGEARELARRLVALEPANPDYQRDLQATHVAIGERLLTKGDSAAALAAFRESLAIAIPLAARDPSNARWQGDLAQAHQKVAEALMAQGDSAGALAELRTTRDLYASLAARSPDNAFAQADVSGVEAQLGEILLATGDPAGATRSFRAVLTISEALAAKDPANADRQWVVAFAHEKVGDGLRAQRDPKGALGEYRAALAAALLVAERDPDNALKQQSVLAAHDKIGDLLLEAGDRPGAIAAYEASFAISAKLAAKDPANADRQRNLAIAHMKRGDLRTGQRALDDALAEYRTAREILDKLAAADPTSASRASDAAVGIATVGKALLAKGDAAGAITEYRVFVAIAETLAKKNPDNPQWPPLVVEAHTKLGNALLATGDRTGGVASLQVALEVVRRMPASDPDVVKTLRELEITIAKASR